MMLQNLDYINIPEITGDMKSDVREIFMHNSKEHLYNHVVNVANANIQIARRFNLDEGVCEIGAYLHDIAGVVKPADMLSYVKSNNLYLDAAEEKYPFLLHQRFSAIIAEELFGIRDENIISPIGYHTTLRENPSEYDMALFIADKLAWDQALVPPYFEVVKIELEKSLYHASLAYINFIIDRELILLPHKWLLDARNWLRRKCD